MQRGRPALFDGRADRGREGLTVLAFVATMLAAAHDCAVVVGYCLTCACESFDCAGGPAAAAGSAFGGGQSAGGGTSGEQPPRAPGYQSLWPRSRLYETPGQGTTAIAETYPGIATVRYDRTTVVDGERWYHTSDKDGRSDGWYREESVFTGYGRVTAAQTAGARG